MSGIDKLILAMHEKTQAARRGEINQCKSCLSFFGKDIEKCPFCFSSAEDLSAEITVERIGVKEVSKTPGLWQTEEISINEFKKKY